MVVVSNGREGNDVFVGNKTGVFSSRTIVVWLPMERQMLHVSALGLASPAIAPAAQGPGT